MKDLTTLEKEFFNTMGGCSTSQHRAIEAAALCERKMREAIEMAREPRNGLPRTEQEIIDKLSNPK